jgi:hypothetical protein
MYYAYINFGLDRLQRDPARYNPNVSPLLKTFGIRFVFNKHTSHVMMCGNVPSHRMRIKVQSNPVVTISVYATSRL